MIYELKASLGEILWANKVSDKRLRNLSDSCLDLYWMFAIYFRRNVIIINLPYVIDGAVDEICLKILLNAWLDNTYVLLYDWNK